MKSLTSGRVEHGRFLHVSIREGIDSCLASHVIKSQHYHNRFYLYGLYNRMSNNSIYACNNIFGMYGFNSRGSTALRLLIDKQIGLLSNISSFMNMNFGVPFNPSNEAEGVDVLRGISWLELSEGVDMLNDFNLKLHYLSASNNIKINRSNKHMWSYINEYRHQIKNWLTETQLNLYRKFRTWFKAEQFNEYMMEENIQHEINNLYSNLQNWCKLTDEYMFDMTTHDLNMILYNNTSAAMYGDESYACTKMVNNVIENGAAMVIQNAMRRCMKRKCIGVHRGRSNFGFFNNIYTDLNLNRVNDSILPEDNNTPLFASNVPRINNNILNNIILTSRFYFTWLDWMEQSILGKLKYNEDITFDQEAFELSRKWWPTDGYSINRISIRDGFNEIEPIDMVNDDDDDDDIEHDIIGPDYDVDETIVQEYNILAEIDNNNAPAA